MSMKSVIFLPFVVDLGIVAKCVVDPAVTQIRPSCTGDRT